MSCALRQINLGDIGSFAVISDVHLRSPSEALTKKLIETLRAQIDKDAVFLLGDIFDFVFIAKDFFENHWKNLFDAFCYLQNNGVKVVFIEGNHDFGFEHFLPKALKSCFTAVGDIEVYANHHKLGNIHFRHGDDVICPPSYLPFRRLVKSKTFQSIATVFPGRFLDWFFQQWATTSRGRHANYSLPRALLETHVSQHLSTLLSQKPNLLILGHIHVYADIHIDDVRVLVGPDWLEFPSILTCDSSGVLKREFLSEARPSYSLLGDNP